MDRGFILQSTYRIDSGKPVVLIYGRLESGESFLLRDSRQVPHFCIRRRDSAAALALGFRPEDEPRSRSTFTGEPVARVNASLPHDVPAMREQLSAAGIPCYEADVPFASRYLIDRGIRGSIQISGERRAGQGTAVIYDNPSVEPGDWVPVLSVLSLDIETDPAARRLFSIALHGCGISEVLLFNPKGYKSPAGAIPYPHEKDLLEALVKRIAELDPDILTGWNVVDFDLAVLQRIAERCGVKLILGRSSESLRFRNSNFSRAANQAQVAGRIVLDGIELLRGAFVRLESYALDAAAKEILGTGKTITGADRPAEILRLFKEDRKRFIEYNLNDARLVSDILAKLNLVPLSVERSRLTGLPPDRVSASIAAFDYLYLSELARRGVVAPVSDPSRGWQIPTSGGHVLEPDPGYYENVLVFDFRSLYPSIIRTFQIDPLGYRPDPGPGEDPIIAPNGAAFRRSRGILPAILDDLMPRRARAAAAGDDVASHAIKILMNSFYGVLGTPACRFAAPELANAITGFGRELLLWSREKMEHYGNKVIYGDTDSLFVLSGRDKAEQARTLGRELAAKLNGELGEYIRSKWGVESRLELRFERLYLRFFLPSMRHGSGGARKRYAGLIEKEHGTEVVFTGMEAVRRDWTELARRVQREIYRLLFAGLPVEEYLRKVIQDVRAGRVDDLLVYRKAIRKDLDHYVASTPPHVAAARKTAGFRGSLVTYVITRNGPEPAGDRTSPLDYEHYIQKQIRAVAEPVLDLLKTDFSRIAGDDAQMRLF
jgi:DNA polymerase II